jgi:hypothetical protein
MTSSINLPRRAALVALAVFAALALAWTPSAGAAELEIDLGIDDEVQNSYLCDAKVGNTFALACFNNHGDVLYTADWENDSMRVATHWRLADGSRRGLCISMKGPVWVPIKGWVGRRVACNKNMDEGKRIEIRAGRCDGTDHDCKSLDDYENWTAWEATTV